MPTRNINLTDHFDRFIETEVGSGQYGSASEVVREGLRLMERRKQEERAKLKWLRGAVRESLDQIDRGEGVGFASMDELEQHIDQLGKEASAEFARKGKRPESGEPLRVVLAPAARRDIREALLWSQERFGERAATRYRDLLKQAIRDIAADPGRPGSQARPNLARGVRTYHLFFSRDRAPDED